MLFDVVIVGGGVTGTALLSVLSRYTNIGSIAFLEKNANVAEVNSHPLNNAQTSHDGGTETNYNLEHALEVQHAARLLRAYVEKRKVPGLFKITNRMVLGVGADEVAQLAARFDAFKKHYQDLRLVSHEELRVIEPKLMEGRDPHERVCALVSDQGYAIDYQVLSMSFLGDAAVSRMKIERHLNTAVLNVKRDGDIYRLTTSKGEVSGRVVVFAAGSYSLLFAQMLGHGMDLAILPVAGSFFSAGPLLNGKVYRCQIEGMPFAAIHGDPDVLNQSDTRFGPTTKPLPLMERHRYRTFTDFTKLPLFSIRGLIALMKILWSKRLFTYVVRNALYDVPVIGKLLFLREARVIVPTLRYRDLKLRRGVGGIRPQIVNLTTGKLEMGDKTIVADNCIFNTTPSPGASVCLANAVRDAARVVSFLGSEYRFDQEGMERDLGIAEAQTR